MSRVTPAELRALEAFARRFSYKGAAHELGRSQHTVTRQLASARAKLDASSTFEAALRAGVVTRDKPAA